ncbi:MAG TPA: bifunctional 5,10-methylenetetrahydrofolate dehydrogenase/5,10-methenyltetrahydrofolate cyclohydrolase [Candidatus Dormibacteraeota bacterium]|nr:bifunctional 5,10-methylenetetrahydrofolate dehydrogenase/5,10-methenyltetrahydrofolate cyclohydrolase [Candidatus Dormibacteraeota bacterium]
MKILDGRELASYIKNRQLREVATLRINYKKIPKLAIIQIKDDPVINTYVRLKKQYGSDIGIEVESFHLKQSAAIATINKLNTDNSVDGIIVQLPIDNIEQIDEILNAVDANKDVDALATKSQFDPATPTAILWLLAGYNIDLRGKNILIIGNGKLVGKPLSEMLIKSGQKVTVADSKTKNLKDLALESNIIITATGSPAILRSDMISHGSVIVDAGVATDKGKSVGDLDESVYLRDDLTITPARGGVGPLTICSLFSNVIKSAQNSINQKISDKL